MASNKLTALLEAVKQATEKGKLAWEDTPSETVFRVWIGDGAVKIGEFTASSTHESYGAGERFYRASVLDSREEVVEEIEAADGPVFQMLEDLYVAARRNAKKSEQVLDKMLKTLAVSV